MINNKSTSEIKSVVRITSELLKIKGFSLLYAIGLLVASNIILSIGFYYFYNPMLTQLYVVGGLSEGKPELILIIVLSLIPSVVHAIFWVFIAIKTHKALIEPSLSKLNQGAVQQNEISSYFNFIIRAIILGLITGVGWYLIIISFSPDEIYGWLVVSFFMLIAGGTFWLASRFILVLPSTAVRRPMTFYDAFIKTKKHQVLVFFVTAIVPLIFVFLQYFIVGYFTSATIMYIVFESLLANVLVVLELALLSVTYMYVIKKSDSL